MRQLHRNLFFYYRGASSSTTNEHEGFDRQLEDNSTKALLNVLEMADRKSVLIPFLNRIAHIKNTGSADTVEFALQRADIRQPTTPTRVALVIAPERGLIHWTLDKHERGRPDAWIWNSGLFSMLIENKIVGQVSHQQIDRHIRGAHGWSQANTRKTVKTWADVYQFFISILSPAQLDPTSTLLVQNFVEYLRMTNFASSPVFEIEDFAFFMSPNDERHPIQRAAVKSKLEHFSTILSKDRRIRSLLRLYSSQAKGRGSMVNSGAFQLHSRSFWITLGPKEQRGTCHLTIRIDAEGISIDCFSPFKSYTKKLLRRIQKQPNKFIAALSRIKRNDPFCIRLREAYFSDPNSSYKGQSIKRVNDFLEVHPRLISPANIDELIVKPLSRLLSRRDLRPELFLVHYFPIGNVVRREDIADQVIDAAVQMRPFLQYALETE